MTGDRMIELAITGGGRVSMRFAQECPFLAFYQGFYYRRGEDGRLCAGRDRVQARSGSECAIEALERHRD